MMRNFIFRSHGDGVGVLASVKIVIFERLCQ